MPSSSRLARLGRRCPPLASARPRAARRRNAVGLALAKSLTLGVANNATVTNFNTHASKQETIAVNSPGFAAYWLSGDSKTHPKCTKANGCFQFWLPVTVTSAGK